MSQVKRSAPSGSRFGGVGKRKHADKKKSPANAGDFFLLDPGGYLLSRTVASQVPSAYEGLTSVFGMGTGGTLQLNHRKGVVFENTLKTAQSVIHFDQALDLLVSVSFTCYHASTSDLSTL